jgi:hypothetical protein
MLNFERYVASLGEFGVQDIIERIERYEGIRSNRDISLEDRWNMLMQCASMQQQMAA